ncbi:MAG: ATP-binding protein, partial [Myxococcota bacterium]
MDPLTPWIVQNGATLALMGAVCAYVHRRMATQGLRPFSLGFALGAGSLFAHALDHELGPSLWGLVAGLLLLASASLLAVGGFRLAGRDVPRLLRWLIGLNAVWVPIAATLGLPSEAVISPLVIALNSALLVAGVAILQADPRTGSAWFAGGGLVLVALNSFTYPILSQFPGQLFWGYFAGSMYNVGVATGIVMLAFERSQRAVRDAEHQLAAARRMEAIGTLAGGVAHDFNNLLTVMIGNLELLRTENTSAEEAETLDVTVQAAEQASRLTAQLLALGRRHLASPEPVDMQAAVDGAVRVLWRTLPARIELEVTNLEASTWVLSDRGGVEQLLLNLVANARDALPDGGRIAITVELEPGGLVLRVTDDGVGMDDETLDRIFEPFYTTKQLGRGTGLGMASVQALVEQMSGTIDIGTRPGEGTTVTIRLPVRTAPASDRVEAGPGATSAKRVLLVEDEPPVRHLMMHTLERAGHEVVAVGDGAEALEIIGRGIPFDLVVSDMVMPRLSGLELARTLRSRAPHTPMLVVSGHPRAPELPAHVRFLQKPFSPSQLLDVAHAAMVVQVAEPHLA